MPSDAANPCLLPFEPQASPTTTAPLPRTKIIAAREARSDAAGGQVNQVSRAGQVADPKQLQPDTAPIAAPVIKPARPTTPAGTYAPTAL